MFLESAFPDAARPALRRINALLVSPSAVHAVKPRVALVVPARFDAANGAHRDELALALEVVAPLLPGHSVELLSDGADLSTISTRAGQLTDEALRGCVAALCVLDRTLAERCSRVVRTRLVGTDTAYFVGQKWRLTFTDPAALPAGTTCAPDDLLAARGALLYVDHLSPTAGVDRVLAALGARYPALRVLVSRQLDAAARERLAAGLPAGATLAVLEPSPDAEPWRPEAQEAVLLSTDPLFLRLHAGHHQRVLVTATGELRLLASEELAGRHDALYLHRGEELDELTLLNRLRGAPAVARKAERTTLRTPLISLIVPVYDRDWEILRLARSIVAQDYPYLEVVFVTNGSPPHTLRALDEAQNILLRKRLRVRRHDFARAFGCATVPRDVGAYAARGELLCFIDTDDYFEPGFFRYFAEKPVHDDVIYAPKKVFRDGGRKMRDDFPFDQPQGGMGDLDEALFETLWQHGNIFNNSGAILSKRLFVESGGILHSLRYCEDYYLWLRAAKLGARCREHAGAVSITLHPGNNELNVGDDRWLDVARSAAQRGLAL